ncbi:L,D-transpeptidase family protein [Microvirga tunisiensis]|uniref:L,D-transpeptidase family protein n=2 Tax=Pannonibacter tanglangensis TaxID=2750084 RepID=A0A7X5F261_9HYPH|nr:MULTISPECIES: L,D-transpeptidase [unclassified Pannonibacter]NBN62726.1 L,D-transpeptidase family protein [Pannonibacter sp. XCT-34]NBN78381.1 L,D-transpeptidase family protein [Pannonibacter sp. XCT-53]
MLKMIGLLAAVALVAGTSAASAQAGRFYDPVTQRWESYGPGLGSQKSPVERELVSYSGPYAPGTIVVDTKERRLYHVLEGGKAMKYGVGVGKEGMQWSGVHKVTRKAEWPGWTPPPQMRARERAKGRILPVYMEGGINNPLGARALYIGSTIYRIHGTNQPWTIGSAVSSGCIRMANEDVEHLYDNVEVGATVVVKR